MVEAAQLGKLREEFMKAVRSAQCMVQSTSLVTQEDGLENHQFVEVMLRYLPTSFTFNRVEAAKALNELFAQVDVNGDGTMEWEEFTAFCIEAGMTTGVSVCQASYNCAQAWQPTSSRRRKNGSSRKSPSSEL